MEPSQITITSQRCTGFWSWVQKGHGPFHLWIRETIKNINPIFSNLNSVTSYVGCGRLLRHGGLTAPRAQGFTGGCKRQVTSQSRFKFALEIKQPHKSGSSKQWSFRRKSCSIEVTEKKLRNFKWHNWRHTTLKQKPVVWRETFNVCVAMFLSFDIKFREAHQLSCRTCKHRERQAVFF